MTVIDAYLLTAEITGKTQKQDMYMVYRIKYEYLTNRIIPGTGCGISLQMLNKHILLYTNTTIPYAPSPIYASVV